MQILWKIEFKNPKSKEIKIKSKDQIIFDLLGIKLRKSLICFFVEKLELLNEILCKGLLKMSG